MKFSLETIDSGFMKYGRQKGMKIVIMNFSDEVSKSFTLEKVICTVIQQLVKSHTNQIFITGSSKTMESLPKFFSSLLRVDKFLHFNFMVDGLNNIQYLSKYHQNISLLLNPISLMHNKILNFSTLKRFKSVSLILQYPYKKFCFPNDFDLFPADWFEIYPSKVDEKLIEGLMQDMKLRNSKWRLSLI